MTYRKTGSQEYRLPKRGWQAGISVALSEIEKLKREGWVFEIERGAMTQDQANYFMQVADRLGNETKVVPVSDGEAPAVFIGYKPSEKAKAPKSKAAKKEARTDPVVAWQRHYYKKNPEDMKEDDGAFTNPDGSMALLRPDADGFADTLDQALNQTLKTVPLQYRKITLAEIAATNAGNTLKYITFAKGTNFKVELVKDAIRVLGYRTKKVGPTAYLGALNKPLLIRDPEGWSVLIAPMVSSPDPGEAETIETIHS